MKIHSICTLAICMFFFMQATNGRELRLALEDEFNTFNLSLWKHEITLSGGGNWEFQAYLNNRSNSYVRDGILYLKPTLMEDQIGLANVKGQPNSFTFNIWGGSPADLCTQNQFYGCERVSGQPNEWRYLNPIKSARIRTAESFNFKYGKVEVKAKLPIGDWLWPAIWMLPTHQQYGIWPSSGEIDIMESRGNSVEDYSFGGYENFGSTLHWGIDYLHNYFDQTHVTMTPEANLTEEFHVYGLIWNETYIGTYFDDESNVVLNVPINQSFWSKTGLQSPPWDNPWKDTEDNAPFNQEYYLIMNVAVGGVTGFFPDAPNKPWQNDHSHTVNQFYDAKDDWYPTWDGENSALQVDSVRIWTYSDDDDTGSSGGMMASVSYATIIILAAIVLLFAAN